MQYSTYENILEYIPQQIEKENTECFELFQHIKSFINLQNIRNVIISLSGGVDSMVLTYILKCISLSDKNIKLYCCHLNYNNRRESKDEALFLIDWCNCNNIILEVKNIQHITRGDKNRGVYEEETRNIRYEYYKELVLKYDCDGVMLGHHRDDLSENVFNNIMRGRKSITDLSVLKNQNIVDFRLVCPPDIFFLPDFFFSSFLPAAQRGGRAPRCAMTRHLAALQHQRRRGVS